MIDEPRRHQEVVKDEEPTRPELRVDVGQGGALVVEGQQVAEAVIRQRDETGGSLRIGGPTKQGSLKAGLTKQDSLR